MDVLSIDALAEVLLELPYHLEDHLHFLLFCFGEIRANSFQLVLSFSLLFFYLRFDSWKRLLYHLV